MYITPEQREHIVANVLNKRPSPGGWANGKCPFCAERMGSVGSGLSFGVRLRDGYCACFRCGVKGKIKLDDEFLAFGASLAEEEQSDIELPEDCYDVASNWDSIALEPARRYLVKRGLTREDIAQHGILACIAGRFAGRVIIPIYEQRKLVWFIGRAWTKKHDVPYLYPKGDRRGVMWGAHLVQVETSVPLLVVEGAFDAIAHYPNACATLGSVTDYNLESLVEAKRPVVFFRDGDAKVEGMCCAWRLRMHPRFRMQAGSIDLGARLDPDEVSKELAMEEAYTSLFTWQGEAVCQR